MIGVPADGAVTSALLTMVRSALSVTVTGAESALLLGSGSGVGEVTEALLVSVSSGRPGSRLTATTKLAAWPAGSDAWVQVTVGAVNEQPADEPIGSKERPGGRVSVTTGAVALDGPALTTVRV